MKTKCSSLLKSLVLLFSSGLFFACAGTPPDRAPWVNLFDGETLEGWSTKGGNAAYHVEDSAIVGTTVHNTPNTFLTTEENYDDFILELDFKVHPSMNSGIQIRSNSLENYRNGQVHGYQVEIDPSERAWSGGIYDEARRGWLFPLTDNPAAQKAFKQNEWNTYRIEAIGDTIKTWINDTPAAHLIDSKTREGFIALQVHSIGENDEEGTQVKWKNIKILTENPEKYSRETSVKPITTEETDEKNTN